MLVISSGDVKYSMMTKVNNTVLYLKVDKRIDHSFVFLKIFIFY